MKSLQNKILIFFVGLLLILNAIVFYWNYHNNERQEQQRIESLLNAAQSNFQYQFDTRSFFLAAFAETAAKDFGLKQVFEEDTRSLLVALNNHRKRIDADLVMAVNTDGLVIGQLVNILENNGAAKVQVGAEQSKKFRFMPWLSSTPDHQLYQLNEGLYQLNFSPLTSGDLTIGWIGFGYVIDQKLAKRFTERTGLITEFAIKEDETWRVFASAIEQPGADKNTMVARIMANDAGVDVIDAVYPLGTLAHQQPVVAVMYGARSALLQAIQEQWQEILFLALLMLFFSLLSAYWIATSIARPVKMLVNQVIDIIAGHYTRTIDFASNDELGQLAAKFNEMKQAINSREQTISYQAYHDQLTGLANRYQLMSTIETKITDKNQHFALIRLSPQRLKDVNYSLGHDVGDDVVREIARRLGDLTVAHSAFNVGGSAFALLLAPADRETLAQCFAEIEQIMASEFQLQNINLNIQLKMGGALSPEHSQNGAELLKMAGVALQKAQKNKLPWMVYDPSFSWQTIERLELINGLKSAIEKQQLVLFYQPKLDLTTGLITEVEALVRWQHPKHGMVPPDKFIGLAEQTGYIHQLTLWVLDTALHQHNVWQQQAIHLPIAINVSAENLKYSHFYDQVVEAVDRHGLTPTAICLEITESVVVDEPTATIALLTRFRDRGFRLSVDDYGTGYSSLAQLAQLPICEMKIDKAFITDLLQQSDDQVIVRSTISLAHQLKLSVVAEGIEDQSTLTWLAKQGCDLAQGYFISRPQPAGPLTDWLAQTPYFNVVKNAERAEMND